MARTNEITPPLTQGETRKLVDRAKGVLIDRGMPNGRQEPV